MKIDRLLGLTIYLLNHGKCSAPKLAEHFEVSQRTILRDIETLCMAGIPVVSTFGVGGGYEISSTFIMKNQVASEIDYGYIVTALQGLSTAYQDKELDAVLEKMNQLTKSAEQEVYLDLSVAREKPVINERLSLIGQAIKRKRVISFSYQNAQGKVSTIKAEPVYTIYQWYHWYLIAYSQKHKDYRSYKLIRMDSLEMLEESNTKEHDVTEVRKGMEHAPDTRKRLWVRLLCKPDVRGICKEYLNGRILSEQETGEFVYEFVAPEGEQFWYGVLLSMGSEVCVLDPEELKQRIVRDCQKILSHYGITGSSNESAEE